MSILHSVFNDVWIELYFHAVKNNVGSISFMEENKEKLRDYARLTRLSAVGIAMILCTAIGFGIGYYLDKWLHTAPVFLIIFLIFGICAGFLNAYRTIIKDSD